MLYNKNYQTIESYYHRYIYFFNLLNFAHALKNIDLSGRLKYGILLIKSVMCYIAIYLQY